MCLCESAVIQKSHCCLLLSVIGNLEKTGGEGAFGDWLWGAVFKF